VIRSIPSPDKPGLDAAGVFEAGRGGGGEGGFKDFAPDVCLINRYEPGRACRCTRTRTNWILPRRSCRCHWPARDLPVRRIEAQRQAAEISFAAWRCRRVGGPSRLFFHGVAPLADGEHAVLGRQRINLTFRKAR
jgi:alkylated DNA repair protein (DNA oxidative demethylase)